MVDIYHRIKGYADVPQLSKHEQLVNGVIDSIDDGVVERGQILPSINKMANELGFARKTIDRAYAELKYRGLIESRNRRGYFVSTESVGQTLKVALVMYEFRPFQEMFYNVFREIVGENVQVETFFHHNNLETLEDICAKINGRYGFYVVAPIEHKKTSKLLRQLNPNRLLIVDRHLEEMNGVSWICQEFEQSTFKILTDLTEQLSKYKEVVLFYREHQAYPPGILSAFKKFCREHKFKLTVLDHYIQGTLQKNTAYVTIGDFDLWSLLEDCINLDLELGKDIGILSHNESRIKKLVHGGVSTWSTDFSQMAERAATYVMERTATAETIPTVFIDRGSL